MDKKNAVNKDLIFSADVELNQLYPLHMQKLSRRHWTPLLIAKESAVFLGGNEAVRILDIGSGVGKFCHVAGHFQPKAEFFGVEQRQQLVEVSENIKDLLGLRNVTFLHENFTTLDFSQYDHFYFYNSFYENLTGTDKIDDSVDHSAALYDTYTHYLYRQLDLRPEGTRLVTYHSLGDEVPSSYHVVRSSRHETLKFWIKV